MEEKIDALLSISMQIKMLNTSLTKISRDIHLIRNKLFEQTIDNEYLKKVLSNSFEEDLTKCANFVSEHLESIFEHQFEDCCE